MLVSQQSRLQQRLPEIKAFFLDYRLDPQALEALTPLIERFEIRVPLIGAFSSGKSSLVNALLGEKLLSVQVTPETVVASELRYADSPSFTGYYPDGSSKPLTAGDLTTEGALADLAPEGWVDVRLPNDNLKRWPWLVLVDLPGLDSGIEAHERAIERHADKSLAYAVVVSVEEGGLRDSLLRVLEELAARRVPLLMVITKADKRSAADVAQVRDAVRQRLERIPHAVLLAEAVTAARKGDVDAFIAALDTLQARAGEVFAQHVLLPVRRALEKAREDLAVLANHEHKDAARLQAEIDALSEQARQFDARLAEETEALAAQLGPVLAAIRQRVENALAARLESFTSRVLHGGDLGNEMLGAARIAVAEAIREEFQPALKRYLDRLIDALPPSLDFSIHIERSATEGDADAHLGKTLGAGLAGVLLKTFPHPAVKIAALVLPILGMLFDSHRAEQRRALEAARQREAAREQVLAVIGDVTQRIEAELRPALHEHIRAAQAEVARQAEAERSRIEHARKQLIQALEEGEAQAAQLRARAEAGLAQLDTWIAEINAMLDQLHATA